MIEELDEKTKTELLEWVNKFITRPEEEKIIKTNELILLSFKIVMNFLDNQENLKKDKLEVSLQVLREFVSRFSEDRVKSELKCYINKIKEILKIEVSEDDIKQYNDKRGYIYILKCHRFYKIGRSKNADRRFDSINSSFPYRITLYDKFFVDNCFKCETELHRKFKDKRKDGEWFELNELDLEYIKGSLENYNNIS